MNSRTVEGFLAGSRERIIIFDGGMGTQLQKLGAPVGGCMELLNAEQPDMVLRAHAAFLSAGADVVETNSFGGARHTLDEHGLGDRCFALNRRAAEIARAACRDFATSARPRWVAGSIGPGSKLPSLGAMTLPELADAYRSQIDGLLAGGVDCLIVETSQDILQLKAALAAIDEAFERAGRRVPIIAQVTLDAHGRTLTGSDAGAVLAALEPFALAAIGLNCGLGPEGMTSGARFLSGHSSRLLSVMPNAGLPRLVSGRAEYNLSPEDFARQMKRLAVGSGLNIAGGCCGTMPEHIRAMAMALEGVSPGKPQADGRQQASVSSLFQSQEVDVHPKPLICGERTNASGSKKFRDLLLARDFDGMVRMARAQKEEGAHLVDLSVAAAGLDETADMDELCRRLNTELDLPVMVDSTNRPTIEAALRRLGGRSIVNSVNLEDPARARETIVFCRRFGAALVLMTIDSRGMAMTCERKLEVADRLYDLAVQQGGLAPESVFFDFLTFTLASGDESLRPAAHETLKALREAKQRFPRSFTILGVSNVSYGLVPAARKALNTVFLRRAIEHGLDAAILHPGRIEPLSALEPEAVERCDELIFNRVHGKEPPIARLLARFAGQKEKPAAAVAVAGSAKERLGRAVIAGDQSGLGDTLAELLKTVAAPAAIEEVLIPAMAEVGRLFESGSLQLPFVLRSAETMRAALDLLKPSLGAEQVKSRGRLVIATVRGDIHDVGKNLVEMILSSNGFEVVNLGVRRTPEEIVEAVLRHKPDAVGLSGLLVESARAMREYLQALAEAGFNLPVLCGGAALSREYVEKDLQASYAGQVRFARDAMEGLRIMQEVCDPDKSEGRCQKAEVRSEEEPNSRVAVRTDMRRLNPGTVRQGPPRPTPERPISSLRALVKSARVSSARYLSRLDRDAVLRKRWKMVTGRSSRQARADAEATLNRLLKTAGHARLWHGALCYAVYRCRVEGLEMAIIHPGKGIELARLNPSSTLARRLTRQFGKREFPIALQLVTVGSHVVEETRKLADAGKVHDQFLLHGLAAEMTEALAEYCQGELPKLPGFSRTVRYSPGYPVWPALSEQRKVFALLGPERLGVSLTDGFQMVPEYSTSAVVLPK